jgi:alcohol dehydrogenase class IV
VASQAPPPFGTGPFRWRDANRLIAFGRGCSADLDELTGGEPYALITSARGRDLVPGLADRATAVHEVASGNVDELAAELRDAVEEELLVALGGGRVIDTAKALAAADPPRRVAAIPTTLSAAEMTRVHRHAKGVAAETEHVRPALVLNDPALSASQPDEPLAASAGNALGHAVEGPMTEAQSPLGSLAGLEAARLIAHAWDAGGPDRDGLALASLLSGYSIDVRGYGLHHVMSQTLVRLTPAGHGQANSAMLPSTLRALARRRPERMDRLATAMGSDPFEVAGAVARRAGAARLRDLGVTDAQLEACAKAAAGRGELHATPPAADREELLAIYREAF